MIDEIRYIKYESKIKKSNNKGSLQINIPRNIGNPGDVVEVYAKVIRRMVEVE